jgi:hypothetical protein
MPERAAAADAAGDRDFDLDQCRMRKTACRFPRWQRGVEIMKRDVEELRHEEEELHHLVDSYRFILRRMTDQQAALIEEAEALLQVIERSLAADDEQFVERPNFSPSAPSLKPRP